MHMPDGFHLSSPRSLPMHTVFKAFGYWRLCSDFQRQTGDTKVTVVQSPISIIDVTGNQPPSPKLISYVDSYEP
jgi:hypothetical protein